MRLRCFNCKKIYRKGKKKDRHRVSDGVCRKCKKKTVLK